MIIKCLGGPLDGQPVTVWLDERGEPPEVIFGGETPFAPEDPDDAVPYELHRCNDPFSEVWWWAYIVHGKYESTQAEIESTRP